jgi:UDP-N-acetylmuramate dehydrogenase
VNSTGLQELQSRVGGEVLFEEPLATYTTYRIGGPAAALVTPKSTEDVSRTLEFAVESGTRWMALGLGSNVLVSDSGFDGIVIRLGKGLDEISGGTGGDETVWTVGAGTPTPLLARRTAKAGFAGVHRLIGVPGTAGGGVFMNAGAHGQDFSQAVRSVELVEADGSVAHLAGADIGWQYRSSGLGARVIVGVTVALAPADPKELERDVRRYLDWRKSGTPFNEPCCGSVFRNPTWPEGEGPEGPRTAGQMIDTLGLKGYRVGGAEVSSKHANYIVNTGGATAGDVLSVIEHVRGRVQQEFGVELRLEVETID